MNKLNSKKQKKKFNVLLTGGAGYIGSTVAYNLLDKGHSVTIIDNLITGNKGLIPKKAIVKICDISDVKKVNKIVQEGKFDFVMHFAGFIRVEESIKYPKKYLENNFEKSKIFLKICFNNKLFNIIFSSTAAVYGDVKNQKKVNENHKTNPKNAYALSKLKVEKYLINKSKSLPIKYVILRYFNVAGAEKNLRTGLKSLKSTHLIKIATEVALKKKKKLIVNGNNYKTRDGTPVRDFIHVSDLAEMHYLSAKYLLKGKRSNIFNCGYGYGYSVNEVIETFNCVLQKKLSTKLGLRRKSDIAYLVADPRKFEKRLLWKPKFNSLKKIIISSINWERKFK